MRNLTRITSCLLLIASGNAAFAGTPINERMDADGIELLDVNSLSGSVTITGSSRNDITVTGELSENAERLEFRREGDRIIVHVIFPSDRNRGNGRYEGSTLDIAVPRQLAADVNTVSAGIVVKGIDGEQNLATVSGGIETERAGEAVFLNSVSGRIRVTGGRSAARADVSSVSGGLELDSLAGEVNAQTISGRIELESPMLERGDIKSVSGSIQITAALSADARVHATSTSGGITLTLQGKPEGRFEVSSFSGSIDNCFGPKPERPQFGPPSSNLRFTEGDSNARIEITSMSGSVRLCND
jgi:hypothetical protein